MKCNDPNYPVPVASRFRVDRDDQGLQRGGPARLGCRVGYEGIQQEQVALRHLREDT